MNLALPLNEEQRDCLQELTNVAIGAAAESLAELTHHFVNLPIPLIRFVDTASLLSSFKEIEATAPSSIISQQCSVGQLSCHALVVVSDENIEQLAKCIEPGEAELLTSANDQNLLVENLFNTISDTCFDRLSEIFEQTITREKVEIVGRHVVPASIDMHSVIDTEKTVAVEIYYHTENHPFSCHLMLLFPDNVVELLAGSLDRLLN